MADFARSEHPDVQAQLDRLSKTSPVGDRLGLERIGALLERLGRPQDRLPPIFHVAGTNGKGSTIAFLRAALEAAGHKVHVFTSPHLVRFNERIRIAGKLIDDEQLAGTLAEVISAGEGIEPSFFEVATAVALLAFSQSQADACLLEVGLGGRLDATNIIERPLVCGISDLGLDHQDHLGQTLAEIAGEKAAIAKPGVPLVTQDYPHEAATVVARTAERAGARLCPRGPCWDAETRAGRIHFRDGSGALELSQPTLAGAHQSRNAALAVAMLRQQDAIAVPVAALSEGICSARWPARLQLLGPGPLTQQLGGRRVWVDGGHNREAALEIAAQMAAHAPFDMIFGLTSTRAVEDVLGPFAPLVRTAHGAPLAGHLHHDPRDIAAAAQAGAGPRHSYPAFSLEEAVERLAADRDGARDVLIFGSLYLAGEVLAANAELPD